MIARSKQICPECGHRNPTEEIGCVFCGRILQAALPPPQIVIRGPRWREPALFLGIGLLLAPVFTFAPLLQFMGWFLGSLCHETGHCAMGWLLGCPSIPAISLRGHAMAQHGPQSLLLCFAVWVALAASAWQFRHRRGLAYGLGGAALLYPLLAFTGARELLFLLGGHMGELVFALIFFERAISGGFLHSRPERAAHATVGWYLLGSNLWLTWGLLFDADVKAWYARSGSFGLTNDYIRLGRLLGVDLGTVAFLMLLAALAVLPAAGFLARRQRV